MPFVKMPPPPDVKTLQSYLGLVNYMARFQPSLSSVSRPLRDLLEEKVDYVWSPEADKAFNDIKRAITCAPVLSYFDPKKDNWSKSINTASPRIQRLLLRMSRYNVKLEYIAGRHNVIADALSRISLHTSKTTTPYSNAISIDEILCSTIQMSTTGTQRIRDESAKDATLQHLTRTIVDGWPESTKTVLLIYTHSGTSEMNFLLRTNYSSRVTALHYNPRY